MGKANSLSRQPDWQKEVKKDNEDRVLVRKDWLEVRATQLVKVIIERVDILAKIKKSNAKNNEVIKAVKEIKKAKVKML